MQEWNREKELNTDDKGKYQETRYLCPEDTDETIETAIELARQEYYSAWFAYVDECE